MIDNKCKRHESVDCVQELFVLFSSTIHSWSNQWSWKYKQNEIQIYYILSLSEPFFPPIWAGLITKLWCIATLPFILHMNAIRCFALEMLLQLNWTTNHHASLQKYIQILTIPWKAFDQSTYFSCCCATKRPNTELTTRQYFKC